MADGTVGVKQAASPDRLIDNETLEVGGQTVYRQRVTIGAKAGTWDYRAGTSGSPSVFTGRVLQITAVATSGNGSLTIDGGDSIPIPQNVGLSIVPEGNLESPTLVFTDTDSYFVEFVS